MLKMLHPYKCYASIFALFTIFQTEKWHLSIIIIKSSTFPTICLLFQFSIGQFQENFTHE